MDNLVNLFTVSNAMKNLYKTLFMCLVILMNSSCQNTNAKPSIVPAVEVKKTNEHRLNIIGETEPIYFPPMKAPFLARIDTGAQTSSLDAKNIRFFERDGEKWVSFTLVNRQSGEKQRFEKEIHKQVKVKRIEESEKRTLVDMDVKFGDETFNTVFSLANREKFEYQTLIGRNIITGRAIVDTSLSNTLH